MNTSNSTGTNASPMDKTFDFSQRRSFSENTQADGILLPGVNSMVGSSVVDDDRTTTTEHQSNKSHRSSQLNLSKAILNVGGTRHEGHFDLIEFFFQINILNIF